MMRLRSLLEYSYVKHLEQSGLNVTDFSYEPFKIPYKTKRGRNRTYIPDFYVEPDGLLVEIKPWQRVTKKSTKFKLKIEAAKRYCGENDLEFKVLTDKDFRRYTLREARLDPNFRLGWR